MPRALAYNVLTYRQSNNGGSESANWVATATRIDEDILLHE